MSTLASKLLFLPGASGNLETFREIAPLIDRHLQR